MLTFHTPTLVKALRIVHLPLLPLLCLQKMRNPWHLYLAKFGRDKDKCSKIADVTIPYSNTSQSTTHSSFASSSTLVPTKSAKFLFLRYGATGQCDVFWIQCYLRFSLCYCLSSICMLMCQQPDPTILTRFSSRNADYFKSGWSRGHMTPAADCKNCQSAMDDSHYLTNIVPQDFNNNSG